MSSLIDVVPFLFRSDLHDTSSNNELLIHSSINIPNVTLTLDIGGDGELTANASQLLVVFVTFAFCLIQYALSDVLSNSFSSGFRSLDIKDQRRWNIGYVRGVFGVILPAFSLYSIYYSMLRSDRVFEFTPYSVMVVCISVGFFAFENANLYFMYLKHGILEPPLILHHILGLLTYTQLWVSHNYHFFALCALCEEASAPLTSVGWMLTKCGKGSSRLWFVNQAVLLIVWATMRIFMDIFIVYNIYHTRNFFRGSLLTCGLIVIGVVVLACYLNPYWFIMKARQVSRAAAMKKDN